jgi:hypothetical protein
VQTWDAAAEAVKERAALRVSGASLQTASPGEANQMRPAVCASLPVCVVFWNVAQDRWAGPRHGWALD